MLTFGTVRQREHGQWTQTAQLRTASLPCPPTESDAVLAHRAQILATEHWGLLAARSTAQSEVLTRITIFLTLVSVGLVTIGLLGQASAFSGWFTAALVAILAFLCLIGLMTQMRVINVADQDRMYAGHACVYGMFADALVQTLSGALGWAIAAVAVVGVAWAITRAFQGYRTHQRSWSNYVPRRPTEGPPIFWRDQGP